jgi:hypothetical protein
MLVKSIASEIGTKNLPKNLLPKRLAHVRRVVMAKDLVCVGFAQAAACVNTSSSLTNAGIAALAYAVTENSGTTAKNAVEMNFASIADSVANALIARVVTFANMRNS